MSEQKTVFTQLQEYIMHLEGGKHTVLLSSGTIAVFQTIITLTRSGDEMVVSAQLRPQTQELFNLLLRDWGVTINFVQSAHPRDYALAISPHTRFVFLDAGANPSLGKAEMTEIAHATHKNKIPLVVDASGVSPRDCAPLSYDADIVIRDLALLCASNQCEGGAVTEAGHFDWRVSNVPLIKAGDPCHDGFRWAFDLPKEDAKVAFSMRLEQVMSHIFASKLSQPNAAYIMQKLTDQAL